MKELLSVKGREDFAEAIRQGDPSAIKHYLRTGDPEWLNHATLEYVEKLEADIESLRRSALVHELEGNGSLRQCIHCGRYFHNEGDPNAEAEVCDAR